MQFLAKAEAAEERARREKQTQGEVQAIARRQGYYDREDSMRHLHLPAVPAEERPMSEDATALDFSRP